MKNMRAKALSNITDGTFGIRLSVFETSDKLSKQVKPVWTIS